MSKKLYTESYISDIAEAINEKLDSQENYKISEMADAIRGIVGAILQPKMITPSSIQQTVYPDEGYDGLSSIVVTTDPYLIPENIKRDVEIFGVVGTYDDRRCPHADVLCSYTLDALPMTWTSTATEQSGE